MNSLVAYRQSLGGSVRDDPESLSKYSPFYCSAHKKVIFAPSTVISLEYYCHMMYSTPNIYNILGHVICDKSFSLLVAIKGPAGLYVIMLAYVYHFMAEVFK